MLYDLGRFLIFHKYVSQYNLQRSFCIRRNYVYYIPDDSDPPDDVLEASLTENKKTVRHYIFIITSA